MAHDPPRAAKANSSPSRSAVDQYAPRVASAASEQNPALALNTPPSSRPCGAATPLPEGNPPVKLIGPQERLAEKRGVSALIVGPTGVGKTSLLRTLNQKMLSKTLFIDIEAGDLPIAGLSVAGVRLRTMQEFTDLACAIGGPNPALPPNSTYSTAHYHQVSSNPELMRLAEFDVFFVNSLTALGRLSFAHAGQGRRSRTAARKTCARSTASMPATCSRPLISSSTRADASSCSSQSSIARPTTSARQHGSRRSRARRPRANCQAYFRPGNHDDLGRFRRRQAAGALLRMRQPQRVGLPRERSIRSDSISSSRRTSASFSRETHQPSNRRVEP